MKHLHRNPQQLPFGSVQTESLDMWRWLRCCGLGGSDAAVALGISPYRNIYDLRRQKQINPTSTRSVALRFGVYIEPFIFERLANESRRPFHEGQDLGTLFSKERTWQMANLDGFIGKDLFDPNLVGLEIKHCTTNSLKRWSNGPPVEYIAQLQHYMAVTGWSRFELYCLVVQDDRKKLFQHIDNSSNPTEFTRALTANAPLLRFEIRRNEGYIAHMCEVEERVWRWIANARPT